MTCGGPISPSALGTCSSASSRCVLPFEGVLFNHSECAAAGAVGDSLEMGNLSAVHERPLSYLSNLYVTQADAAAELREAKENGMTLVVDTSHWDMTALVKDAPAIAELSRRDGLPIVIAVPPPKAGSESDEETAIAQLDVALRVRLAEGVDMCAGVIGPLHVRLPNKTSRLTQEEEWQLTVAAKASRRVGGAPILVVIDHESCQCHPQGTPPLDPYYEHMWTTVWEAQKKDGEGEGNPQPRVAVVNPCRHRDDLSGAKLLLRKGCCVGLTCSGYDYSVVEQRWPGKAPLRSPDDALRVMERLVTDADSREDAAGRLMVSTGVMMRMHLKKYGGCGYGFAPALLRRQVPQRYSECHEMIDRMTFCNAVDFLAYPWTPPPAAEVSVQTFLCHWCRGAYPDTQVKYEKLGFTYCSMPCLSSHRKVHFDPFVTGLSIAS
ncbi:unnamed protein product [Vitrella brassicaformis CCMP3155]|uniref:Uncharacterized protein n=1 Tax=Vitrella brassicaformis (strain CCMP3155) TaxID=1169540 RepID=A0A0G4G4Y2_VITBC|nr:unnamed protein product [Vitrella brassicaformis CCMP3155]|eukprot:CEM23463.1 unnamed protein product [Vitrella brassicaformis CCMP3155]